MATLHGNPLFCSARTLIHKPIPLPLRRHLSPSASPPSCPQSLNAVPSDRVHEMVNAFDPYIPLPEAVTPPSSWYTDPSMLELEYDRVFFREWQVAGFTEQVESPNEFLTGRLGNLHFIICRDGNGDLHAFHNVCCHHASLLASGTGKTSCFVCPYHGWTYGLDGALLKATCIAGIKNFNVKDFALVPLKVANWGPFILISLDKEKITWPDIDGTRKEWLGTAASIMSTNGVDCSLKHVCRREYTIECNWKVFCDIYLDGGYHVPYAHGGLASGLKFDSYSTMGDGDFIARSLEESARVQVEDIELCEGVQKGLESPAYDVGRYAPTVEAAMHHFHCLLHSSLARV